jgi:hypothetical protein
MEMRQRKMKCPIPMKIPNLAKRSWEVARKSLEVITLNAHFCNFSTVRQEVCMSSPKEVTIGDIVMKESVINHHPERLRHTVSQLQQQEANPGEPIPDLFRMVGLSRDYEIGW